MSDIEKPPAPTPESKDMSRANSVQPGRPAGEVASSDPSPEPPPNAEVTEPGAGS